MISRDSFVQILDAIKRQYERDYKIGGLITDIGDVEIMGSNNRFVFTTQLIDDVSKSLSADMNDKFGMISYYIYETEFGEKADDFHVTLKNGEKRYFHTAGHLYDYLVEDQ